MKSFCAVTALAVSVASNPFVGEHKDKEYVYHEDGQISHRLTPVAGQLTSFKHYVHDMKPRKDVLTTINDFVFGESDE
jgi:hypothetical protein